MTTSINDLGYELQYLDNDFIKIAIRDPLPCHRFGLTQTATGYGKKLATEYKIRCEDGRTRRVYCSCFSNVGVLYIIIAGVDHIVYDSQIWDHLEGYNV